MFIIEVFVIDHFEVVAAVATRPEAYEIAACFPQLVSRVTVN